MKNKAKHIATIDNKRVRSSQKKDHTEFLLISPFLRWALLLMQGMILIPLYKTLPSWLLLLCGLCLLWRGQLNITNKSSPSTWLSTLLLVAVLSGLFFEFLASLFSLDVNIALLVSMFVIKSLELRKQRDVLLLLYLSIVVIACVFLQDQSLLTSVYLVICLLFVLSLLAASYFSQHLTFKRWRKSFFKSAALLVQSLPLMIFLVVFIPRIEPLWSVPLNTSQARTGMSDSLKPGAVSQLLRSDALVFRAQFSERLPPPNQLYWRGLVLSDFDGVSWTRESKVAVNDDLNLQLIDRNQVNQQQLSLDTSINSTDKVPVKSQAVSPFLRLQGQSYDYQIMLESSADRWLFSLAALGDQLTLGQDAGSSSVNVAISNNVQSLQQRSIAHNIQYSKVLTLFTDKPVTQRMQYDLRSYTQYLLEPRLSTKRFERETRLPRDSNPRAQAQAKIWFAENNAQPQAYVNFLMRWFREQQYFYLLEPPLLDPQKSIDQFLFESKQGFCEHYASAFVFLMRAAGIPARVVVGYQGGKLLPEEKRVVVRQLDAHAWAEWWSAEFGWQRVDPTSAVAPERVVEGAEQSLSGQAGFLADEITSFSNSSFTWLNNVAWRWERLNYNWNRWVLGFDEQRRQSALQNWLGDLDLVQLIKGVAIGIGLLAIFLFMTLRLPAMLRRSKRSSWVGDYQSLQKMTAFKNEASATNPYLPPTSWALKLSRQYPQLEQEIDDYIMAFNSLEYGDFAVSNSSSASHLRGQRLALRRCKELARQLKIKVWKLQLSKAFNF